MKSISRLELEPALLSVASALAMIELFAGPGAAALAQQNSGADAAAGAAGCAGCGLLATGFVLVPLALIALNVALLVWVAKDSKSRGMDNSVMWMILVMFTSLVGLIIYLASRPTGELVVCSSCRNKRLVNSAKCPHCGNS